MNAIARSATMRVPALGAALLIGWVYALRSNELLIYPTLQNALFVALYIATCLGLRQMQRASIPLREYLPCLSFPVAVLATFTLWGTLTGMSPVGTIATSFPPPLQFAPLFAAGPLMALVTSAVIFYPINRIFGMWHWAVPLATGVVVLAIQYDGLNAGRGVTNAVMVSELACLVLIVPFLVAAGIRFNNGENL